MTCVLYIYIHLSLYYIFIPALVNEAFVAHLLGGAERATDHSALRCVADVDEDALCQVWRHWHSSRAALEALALCIERRQRGTRGTLFGATLTICDRTLAFRVTSSLPRVADNL